MEYIQTLGIVEGTQGGKDKRDCPPLSHRPTEKRALVVFAGDGKGAWDIPLFEAMLTPEESHGKRVEQSDHATKHNDDTTTGEDTITKLTDNLSLLKNDFQASINSANAARNVQNNVLRDELRTIKASSEDTIDQLSSFTKEAFTVQDNVISSLKHGQDALDKKIDAMTADVSNQMTAINIALLDFKSTMIDLVGRSPLVPNQDQHVKLTHLSDEVTKLGTQPVLLGGLEGL